MICNFASKSLVMVETGRRAKFYDYAGPFFLMWFFPIGIWFIQPRINRLYSQRMQTNVVDETRPRAENLGEAMKRASRLHDALSSRSVHEDGWERLQALQTSKK